MKRLALLFTLLTWAFLAYAQDHATTLMDPPAWVLKPTPAIDCNFALGAYYNCPLDKTFSVTRASTKYCQWTSQIWMSVASGAPCITDQGWLIEEARTNDALQSRDMTQAAWVSVGMTEALNAIGIDGVANSASTLTATGTAGSCTSSCTDLQTITLGSSADTYSVWLKRVTGTGTVNITINNLTGVTPCTLITTGFTRCTVTATLANPVIGIQMTAVNDVIVADFNQMEPGGFPTSPILTTSASATRAADNVAIQNFAAYGTTTTAVGSALIQAGIISNTTGAYLGANTTAFLAAGSSTVTFITIAGASQVTRPVNPNSVATKVGIAWDTASRTLAVNNSTITSATQLFSSNATSFYLGNRNANNAADGYITRATFWPNFRVPDAQLQMLTSTN